MPQAPVAVSPDGKTIAAMSPEQAPTATACDVSVVIPAYNRAHLIERAIAGVRRQTVAPAEVIVALLPAGMRAAFE